MIRIITISIIHAGPISDIAYSYTEEAYVRDASLGLFKDTQFGDPIPSREVGLRRALVSSIKIVCDRAVEHPVGYYSTEIFLLPRDYTDARKATLLAGMVAYNTHDFRNRRIAFIRDTLDRHFNKVETDVACHL